MRDYLYAWNDPEEHLLVASGIEFRDLMHLFTAGGVILLKHAFEDVEKDDDSGPDFLPVSRLPELASANIYRWGDFRFADYLGDTVPGIPAEQVAELLSSGHTARPLRRTRIKSIGNRFLCSIHDDGWFLQVRYATRPDIERVLALVKPILPDEFLARLAEGAPGALWASEGRVEREKRTFDIDSVLNRRRWKRAPARRPRTGA